MTLIKPARPAAVAAERRAAPRDPAALLAALDDPQVETRRWAALDLAGRAEAVPALCRRLAAELEPAVREALLTALIRAGAPAVPGLLPLLRSPEVALRNAVIDALRQMPEALAPHLDALLADPDPALRIYTLNCLEGAQDPATAARVLELLRRDPDPNVCGTALDLLAQCGDEAMVADIEALPGRLGDDPFLRFAADHAVRCILGHPRQPG